LPRPRRERQEGAAVRHQARTGRGRKGEGIGKPASKSWWRKEKISRADAEATVANIVPVADYAPMAEAEFIIEAATEREEIKLKIFEAAGKVLGADAIMASNTSSIPITRMARSSPDPQRFIGMHFFNPVPLMKLVEVIPGLATAPKRRPTAPARFAEAWARKW
jgi:3-hydroxybutyryl-CoA dehydrogenase